MLDSPHPGPRPRPLRRSAASLALTGAGLLLALYLLWDQRAAFAFYLQSGPPVDLGAPGAFRPDRARNDVYARVAGEPSRVASRFERFGRRYELVALVGSPFVVRRVIERQPAGAPEPPPDPAPLRADGRLLEDRAVPEYAQAYALLVEQGGAQPHDGRLYVLLDGVRPFGGLKVPLLALLLVGLAALNLLSLARLLRRGAAKKRTDTGERGPTPTDTDARLDC